MITWLDPLRIEGHAPSMPDGASHPMRTMTRRVAGIEGDAWDAAARREVAGYFDGLAGDWHTRTSPDREQVVLDALERGLPAGRPAGLAIELGSGIGAYSAVVAARWRTAVAVELAFEMLRRAPAEPSPRVLADASTLPFASASADALVLVNMFLFPAEVERVLAPTGVLVWVNSSGVNTPIHLLPDEVAAALPGAWSGTAAHAGSGLWAVLRRDTSA